MCVLRQWDGCSIERKAECGLAATHNLFSFLNTRFDFGNVTRGIVIGQLLDLMLAHHR